MISATITNNDTNDKLSTPPPEKEEVEVEALRKQYETMSYGEMSKRLADNYKQLSEILGNRISLPMTTESMSDDEQHDDNNEESTTSSHQQIFLKSVSSGDMNQVEYYLSNKELIDIDEKDEDGTTPLIYAACFGKFEIAQALLLAGANIDTQDSHGWSALMWATTNSNEKIVKLLLENGASATTKSAKGRTVLDFVKNDSTTQQKMADIFTTTKNRDSISSNCSSNISQNDCYYQYSTQENYESFLTTENENKGKLIEEYLNMKLNQEESSDDEEYNQDDEEDEEDHEDNHKIEFCWDKCMPDQMFVFGVNNLEYILDTVITKLTLPVRNVQEIFLPTNVVFLSARFAHYFSSSELLEDVMEGALYRISTTIKSNSHNVHILSYWMTNMTRLLYYLKKDVELVVATAEYQLRLSELISETYNSIVNDIGKRITQILEPSMLEFDSLNMQEVEFADDWQRFFRSKSRSSYSEDMQRTSSSSSQLSIIQMSPKSIIQLFSSTYYVLQTYEVHSTIIIQALAQFLHFLSCELFNHILTKKKYLCRSKAIQIRMNLSQIEEWIRNNNLPSTLINYLNPTIQLIQLLQCLSQLDTIESFQSTILNFDAINYLQIKRCVVNYRYETSEPKLSEEIEKYLDSLINESIRIKQARQSKSFERRSSIQPVGQALRRSLSVSSSTAPSRVAEGKSDEEEEEEKEMNETKDTKFMLPFFVPTIAQLSLTSNIYPMIPEDWMEKLDKK